jgi:hypothetical protein
MKNLFLIIAILCFGCSGSQYNADYFESSLKQLEHIKSVLKEKDFQYKQLYDIEYHFPQLAEEIQNLRTKYTLCDIQTYKTGIAFKFMCIEKANNGVEYYILSRYNPNDKNEFFNSKEFKDYRIEEKPYNSEWLFVKFKQ